MKSGTLVSIVTPSYNQGKFLDAMIGSVVNQHYPNLELVVVDGGSTDNSVDVLSKWEGHITGWTSERDSGQSEAFNKGLAKTHGEVVGWLNSDDLYLNRCIWRAVNFFALNPSVDIVFADYAFMDSESRIIRVRKEVPFSENIYLWTKDCYHANCAGFFRRRVFDAIGGLNESLHYSMDYEFYLRAARAGFSFGHVHEVWGAYRLHADSKSVKAFDKQRMDVDKIFIRFVPDGTSTTTAKALKWFWSAKRIMHKLLLGSYFLLIAGNRSIEEQTGKS